MTDTEKLSKLKELLLTEDRDFAQQILQKLDHLEETVFISENLSDKVNPIIDKKIEAFIAKMPNQLGPTITETLKSEIKNSQDTIVDALFPIIGKMIKKYVQQEMKTLSDNINLQMKETFSIKKYRRKIKALFTGVSETEIVIRDMTIPKLEQVFIIEKGSGIIIASRSREQTVDEDMVAGMLTAIKSFVEDAFHGGNQSLENIEYELYSIHIQNFSTYYVAAVLSGTINNYFRSRIQDEIWGFAEKHIQNNLDNKVLIEEKLEVYFKNE